MRKIKRSQKIIEFIEKYCKVPEGDLVGQPLRLAPFQKKFIRAVYDNKAITRRAYLSIARKNAKSALIACLVLVHTVGPESVQNSQIGSGARSREQASIIFDLACKMINQEPELQKRIRIIPSGKRLIGLEMNVEFKALSAEGKTAHGKSLVLAILDEVGQVVGPKDAFVDAIVTAQGAYEEPLLIAISTQAATDADLFSIWLDDAAESKDPKIVSHVYKAKEDAPVLSKRAWKAANPGLDLFRSRADLADLAKLADRMPSSESAFRNLNLNQRVSFSDLFVSKSIWDKCGKPAAVFDHDRLVWCGLDLSKRTDLTAFIMCQRQDKIWQLACYFWTPEKGLRERSQRDRVPYDMWVGEGYIQKSPGFTVDYEYVAKEIIELTEDLELGGIAFDRWRIDDLKKEVEKLGMELPLMLHGQGFKDMSPSLDALEGELLNARIHHGNNPVLTMCASNAIVTPDAAGGRKLDKSKSTGRIDGMVALAMALGMAFRGEEEAESIYEERGVLTFGTA